MYVHTYVYVATYSGAEFSHMPDNEAPHAMNSKVDATSKQTIEFYECRRVATHCTGGQFSQ